MENTSSKIFEASVVQVEALAPGVKRLTFRLKKPMAFQAGQYVWLVLPERSRQKGLVDRRAFSIASPPDKAELELLIQLTSSDYSKAVQKLAVGDTVQVVGPMGHEFILPDGGAIMIAGGTGIAPFVSCLKSGAPGHNTIISYRNDDRPPDYLKELQSLAEQGNFELSIHAGQPAAEHFKKFIEANDSRPILIAGPQGFVDAATKELLGLGVPRARLHYEAHYPSGEYDTELQEIFSKVDNAGNIVKTTDLDFSKKVLEALGKEVDKNKILDKVFTKLFLAITSLMAVIASVCIAKASDGRLPRIGVIAAIAFALLLIIELVAKSPKWMKWVIVAIFIFLLSWSRVDNQMVQFIGPWLVTFPLVSRRFLDLKESIVADIIYISLIGSLDLLSGRYPSHIPPVNYSIMFFLAIIFVALITIMFAWRENMYLEQLQRSINNQRFLLAQKSDTLQLNEMFTQISEQTSNHVILTDHNGVILYANKAAERVTGYSFKEMRGQTPRLWGGLMSHEFYEEVWREKSSGQIIAHEIINRRRDGRIYTAIGHITPLIRDNKVFAYVATEEDITPIKKQEWQLRQNIQRLHLATESAKMGVWELDLATKKLHWDDQTFRLYGTSREESTDPDDQSDLRTRHIHPDDLKRVEELRSHALQGTANYQATFRVVWNDGSVHFLNAHSLLERDPGGNPIRLVGVNWDVTRATEVDHAKSEFVSLASHQLRTPLTAIRWYAELLMSEENLTEEQKSYIQEVYKGNLRMIDLVNALLNVSRLELGTFTVEPKPTDIVALAKSVTEELKQIAAKKEIVVEEHYQENLKPYMADEKLARMILLNLLSNAVKYTPVKGLVKLQLSMLPAGQAFGGKPLSRDCLVLSVADTGIGIPADQKHNIFKKLFRTSNAQATEAEGTGLGLYIVKQVVEQSGGAVWFHSQENVGTIFYVALPASGMKQKSGSRALG